MGLVGMFVPPSLEVIVIYPVCYEIIDGSICRAHAIQPPTNSL